jgi:hypothetical protein
MRQHQILQPGGLASLELRSAALSQICTCRHANPIQPRENWNFTPCCVKHMSKYKLYTVKTILTTPTLQKGIIVYVNNDIEQFHACI